MYSIIVLMMENPLEASSKMKLTTLLLLIVTMNLRTTTTIIMGTIIALLALIRFTMEA